jgi:uncharacterized protein
MLDHFVLKVASRCNLNCDYCYVYNGQDQTWRDQPVFMSRAVVRKTYERVLDYCVAHEKPKASFVLHGGEPLLGGLPMLEMIVEELRDVFDGTGIATSVGIQSNGLLYTEEIGEFLGRNNLTIGISVDGPPHMNDRHRVDHAGRGSGVALEEKIRLLSGKPWFGGLLTVVNLDNDPVEIFDYFASLAPPAFDVLLPDENHTRRPYGKPTLLKNATPYGDWMIRLFDRWWAAKSTMQVRYFHALIQTMLGRPSCVETTSDRAPGVVVIEANGNIGANDAMKAVFQGATQLGMHVDSHSFDDVARHPTVSPVTADGKRALCADCTACDWVSICGGGYLPHRWSDARGFDNPSVYCSDLAKVMDHIADRVLAHARELEVA